MINLCREHMNSFEGRSGRSSLDWHGSLHTLCRIATIGVKPLTSIIIQRVTTQPRLALPFVVYNSACSLPQSGLRGGRGDIKCENCSVKSFFRKNTNNKCKSEPPKCSGLAISRSRQNYAIIGVELRTRGEIFVKY